jgi:gamma-glutamylcyclotransferase (GGCT)/AIG2-like uncharacterized protein YtfP
MNNHTVAVYGTLRKGERANHYLDGANHLGTDLVDGYMYLQNNGWFPFIVDGASWMKPSTVVVDVYDGVTDEQLHKMDQYEGYKKGDDRSLFVRERVTTTCGFSAFLWKYNPLGFLGHTSNQYTLLKSGDWKRKD